MLGREKLSEPSPLRWVLRLLLALERLNLHSQFAGQDSIKEDSYYGGNDSQGYDKYPEKMIVEALELADKYVKDPNDVVKLHQQVSVRVVEVDRRRNRIALSMQGLK